MDSLISTFHIDLNLFIAQIVNFGIVFSILYFLIFKPLVSGMTDRSAKIEKSLKEADEIEKKLASTARESDEIIAAARKQAGAIVEEANLRGEERKNELVAKAKEEIAKVINQEKDKIARDKEETVKAIKQEIAGLVILTTEKVLAEKMDQPADKKLIDKLIA